MKAFILKALKAIGTYLGVVLIFTVILTSIGLLASGYIIKEVSAYKEEVLKEYNIKDFEYQPPLTTEIYSKNGTLLAEIYNENRRYVPYSEIPDNVKNALIAVEDRRFYEHHGVDPKGIARSVASNIASGNATGQGSSTLTMQISRQLFLTLEKTWERKIKEAFISLELENKFDKNKILEIYLNEVYFGHGAYGIESAAQTYFGKSTKELTLEEATLLVGLPQSPSSYDPLGKNGPDKALKRRLAVLDSMVNEEMITREEAKRIANTPVKFYEKKSDNKKVMNMLYPYFTSWAIKELEKEYGDKIYSAGWKIYTTIDDDAQKLIEETAKDKSKDFSAWYRMNDIAMTTINPQTGELVAMVGGSNFEENQVNMADRPRQPGSTMKPLVYAIGIEKGVISDSTILKDEEIDINGYSPKNYDFRHRGYITTREALRISNNIVSVKVAQMTKMQNVRHYLQKMGITTLTDNDKNLGVAIGGMSKGITPYEMATAYGVLANRGELVEPHFVSKIVDRKGTIIKEFKPKKEQVLQKETADITTDMLRDVVNRGTGSIAQISRATAGKTGTTNDNRDLWYVGYTPNAVTTVWVGNSDYSGPKGSPSSGQVSGKTFASYMNKYVKLIDNVSFPARIGLQTYTLYVESEENIFLAGKYCSQQASIGKGEIVTWALQSKFAPTETKDCEPVDMNQYFKDALAEGKTVKDLVDEGYYEELIKAGYISQLVDAGFFDQMAKEGHIEKLRKAGFEDLLIEKGYIEQVIEEPEEPEEPTEMPQNPEPSTPSKPSKPATPPSNPTPPPSDGGETETPSVGETVTPSEGQNP